jgi:hypothetical protein
MLNVITAGEKCPQQFASRFLEDRSRGVVVIESDLSLKNGSFSEAHHELDSMEARHRAIGFANANGVGDARINGNSSGTYPVNKEGLPLEHVRDEHGQPLPLTHPRMHVWRYRIDFPVTRRLV